MDADGNAFQRPGSGQLLDDLSFLRAAGHVLHAQSEQCFKPEGCPKPWVSSLMTNDLDRFQVTHFRL